MKSFRHWKLRPSAERLGVGPRREGMSDSDRAPGAFATFGVFYMTAFVIDLMERWDQPLVVAGFLVALMAIVATGFTRRRFLAFVVVSAGQVAFAEFPDASNHSNLYLFCSVFIVATLLAAAIRPGGARDDARLTDVLFPPLRVTLALVYLAAGFHKLNADFLDPVTSCASAFFYGSLSELGLSFLPVPAFVFAAVPILIVAWELGGGLLLWWPRGQAVMVLASLVMHGLLAMKVFFDFSSMAFALLLTFVPPVQWTVLNARPVAHLGGVGMRRLDLYVGANLLAGAAAGVFFWFHGYDKGFHKWQGLALDLSFLVFVWPMVREVMKGRRGVGWPGVPIWGRGAPAWGVVLPVFVALWALSPYLGLRTTGTFTMFSNLVTEGSRSNHLLLASGPLKLFGYQEDVVRIVDIDPRHASSPRKVLTGYLLPVVELKKRIHGWKQEGLTGMAAQLEYRGQRYETDDIVRDNPWRVDGPDLAMRLLSFRVIEESGRASRCRW